MTVNDELHIIIKLYTIVRSQEENTEFSHYSVIFLTSTTILINVKC